MHIATPLITKEKKPVPGFESRLISTPVQIETRSTERKALLVLTSTILLLTSFLGLREAVARNSVQNPHTKRGLPNYRSKTSIESTSRNSRSSRPYSRNQDLRRFSGAQNAQKIQSDSRIQTGQNSQNRFRLPVGIRPDEYELNFEPDLANFKFTGSEKIKLEILRPCTEIVLNAHELKVSKAEIARSLSTQEDQGEPAGYRSLDVELEPAHELVKLKAKRTLRPGSYELKCSFEGVLNNELRGFYRAQYEDDQHNKRWLAATQMEPTDARRMFPCFDEPAYKAVFNVRVLVDKNLTAISNAPAQRSEEMPGAKKLVVFEPSPKMSSYLLALVVGDLKCGGEVEGGKVPVRVWAVAGREHLGKYALSEAGKILDYESSYFGIPYLGKKMDMVAVPEFSAGAMENIGCVIFKDDALLFDDKTGSSFQKQRITSIIAHEFAHQWFGDLVTMDWWDDLWLNEAFATWLTKKVEDYLHPDWRTLDESVYSRLGAMSTDSLKSTRPIHAEVHNPAQAVEMFDGITYQKGAAVLRMLELFVSESAFQKGISKYLRRHAFANATAEDFWTAIAAEANGAPVSKIMESFVYQPGYAQVNIKVRPQGRSLDLSQYRQLRLGQDLKDPSLWALPLLIRQLDGRAPEPVARESRSNSIIMDERQQRVNLKLGSKLVFVNAGGMGYYRTCYEPDYLKNLQRHFSELSAPEKITLLSDCSSLVLPGDLPVESLYDFVGLIEFENDPLVISDLASIVYGPVDYILDSEQTAMVKQAEMRKYADWICSVLKPLKRKLGGWNAKPNETQQSKQLRSMVLGALGTYGQDRSTISEAFALFEKYKRDRGSVNPDLSGEVLSIVTFNGGAKEYDEIYKLWRTAKNPADEDRTLFSLPGFHQSDLARRTIALGMSDKVKLQDGLGLVLSVASNRYTKELGWAYVKQHWQEIMARFPKQSLASLAGLPTSFDTPVREVEMRSWYATHPVPFGKARTARALESMHSHVLYRKRYGERIRQWVMAQGRIPRGW